MTSSSHEHSRQQEHPRPLPGHHRQGRAVPHQGLPGIRHARWSAASRPAKAGETVEGLPVFDTVAEAVEKTGADATMIFVPPAFAADAILEAVDAGISSSSPSPRAFRCSTWSASMTSCGAAASRADRPELPRRHHARECKIGIMPGYIHKPGPGRRDEPLGHADLRGGLAVDEPRAGPIDLRRPGRRPDRRHVVHRPAASCSRPTRRPRRS